MKLDWQPFVLTFQLASVTTAVLFVIAVPVAYWIVYSRARARHVVEALVSMPLVLPPTVLGFYLLVAFSPRFPLGRFLETHLDLRLVFSFAGLVVGSVIFSLPFMVNPILAGFRSLPASLKEASGTLGKSEWQTLIHVLLPNIRPSLLTGIVLSFAHTIGEFGVVLMIGGNIPGRTRVASIAIYNEVELLRYDSAAVYSLILFLISFSILLLVQISNRKAGKAVPP